MTARIIELKITSRSDAATTAFAAAATIRCPISHFVGLTLMTLRQMEAGLLMQFTICDTAPHHPSSSLHILLFLFLGVTGVVSNMLAAEGGLSGRCAAVVVVGLQALHMAWR